MAILAQAILAQGQVAVRGGRLRSQRGMAPRSANLPSEAAMWRFASSLGRAWRLHSTGVPLHLQVKMAALMRACRAELVPHVVPGTRQSSAVLELLARLAAPGVPPPGQWGARHFPAKSRSRKSFLKFWNFQNFLFFC